MAKKFPSSADVSFKRAVERARKYPSQIADIEAIVGVAANEMYTPDFEVRTELYGLLAKAVNPQEQSKILNNYRRGLEAADREGQINLQEVWQTAFADERVGSVLVDSKRGQLIVSTSPREEVKRAGIYALDLKDGKERWSTQMKKNQSAFSVRLGEFAVFFTTDSHSENEDHHRTKYLYALSLENGSQAMKWLPEDKDDGGVERTEGVSGNLILVRGEWSSRLLALNPDTEKEEWRASGSLQAILDDGFLVADKRELRWLDKNGLVQEKIKFPFPKKNEGRISNLLVLNDVVYLSVYDSWNTYNKDFSVKKEHSHIAFYAVGRYDAKVRWSFVSKGGMHCKQLLYAGDVLYCCENNHTLVLERSSGKLARSPLLRSVLRVSEKLCFHTDPSDAQFKDMFTFYATDVKTDEVAWERKNFRFITAKNGLLFGRVGSMLVILDEATGKQRAKVERLGEPTQIGFIDDNTFWVKDNKREAESVTVFRMEPPEDRV